MRIPAAEFFARTIGATLPNASLIWPHLFRPYVTWISVAGSACPRSSVAAIRERAPDLQLWLEPGRYVVADAGVLLTRITQIKGKGEVVYVGVATGMNSLIRPALYGAYHEIANLTRYGQSKEQLVNIVGPICESGDRLGNDRRLPPCHEGDVLLIANTGAYGSVMSSNYNLRDPAREIVL